MEKNVMEKPLIGVPMGDPAGVGAEITVKSLLDKKVTDVARVIVVGDKGTMEQAIGVCGVKARIHTVEDPAAAVDEAGVISKMSIWRS